MKLRRRRQPQMTLEQHVSTWQIAAALLRYPEAELISALDAIGEAIEGELPEAMAESLRPLLDELRETDLIDLQQRYVRTFDFNRRADLHLTYHAHGDKRQRGLVLLRLKRLYAEHGCPLVETGGELPDFLPVMLEFAALQPVVGCDTMARFRAPIELVRRSLRESENPYACVLDAIVATMPPLQGDEREAIRRLLASGPPEEAVGLEPYAPHDIMPQNEIDARIEELT